LSNEPGLSLLLASAACNASDQLLLCYLQNLPAKIAPLYCSMQSIEVVQGKENPNKLRIHISNMN
jgi:hypothetical protein